MPLVLTEDQEMLRESAAGFLKDEAPVSALRELRDSGSEDGFSRELWAKMAAMGWAGILVPEEYGGADFGMVGAGVVAEEMGKQLTATPYLSSAIMAATALNALGSQAQKEQHLTKIAAGEELFAIAHDERGKHSTLGVALKAERMGNGFRLNGAKTFVADGHVADQIIVSARTSGEPGEANGITLFLVDSGTDGLKIEKTAMVDSRNAARIDFNNAEVTADAVLGEIDLGADGLEKILNAGRAGLAAEMAGSAAQAFGMTLSYINERKQFGVAVGSFQTLQHRSAHLYTEIEICKALTLKALQSLDEGAEDAAKLVALAKAKATKVSLLAAQEGVQMHGGMGMTDEFDIGLYLKRAKVAGELLGDSSYHGNRLAEMLGY